MKDFNKFISEGIVRKQSQDKSRAEFLIKESENSYHNLSDITEKIGIKDENANLIVKLCYDIIMEMIRANMLLKGYNAAGAGAHEAEVAYSAMLNLSETDTGFLDQLRYFRNGMLYYGTILDKGYAEKVINFLKRVYPKLAETTNTI